MIDKFSIQQQVTLKDKMYVCDECLKLLTLRGALKNSFIIGLEISEKKVKCDICEKDAKFIVSSFKRGLWVCKNCLEARGKKHVWMHLKITKFDANKECDICFTKGSYLLIREEK